MPYIRVKTGPNKGKVFEVKDAVITIGRDESQTIQILDQGVSRQHAEIFRIGEMCFVRDLNSTNGVYVNNVKAVEETLKANDELLIGTTLLVFEDRAAGAPGDSAVEFEGGEEAEKIHTTTVELAVDKQPAKKEKVLGHEIQSRNLTLTHDIGKIINSGQDFQAMLTRVVELICEVTSAGHGYMFLHDSATGKLTPKVVVEKEEAGEKKVSRTIVRRVLQTGMPILTSDAALDDRFQLSESVVLKKIKSVVCAPIQVRDRIEGLLYFHSSRVNETFRIEDLELVASTALQLTMALAGQSANERLKQGMLSTIKSLVTAMEIVDPKNQGHGERVADYSTAIARQINLPADEIHKIRLAALLHDVGKLAVHHSAIGHTKDSLKEQHVFAGEKILCQIEGCEEILPGVRYHHERADGSGFPYHVKNDQTPVMARVIIVANAFDNACSWGGLGGQGIPAKDVLKDMAQRGGKEFDDDIIKALLICHRNGSLYSGGKLPEKAPAK